ncbi:MAG: ORF6N domain-containing protein [Ignavibacteriales bacterium]|nr:ORF6N domain-containing protein [Ignavibacteriales bacterium]
MPGKRRINSVAARVDALILLVRGERVIIDSDLASIYGVPTKRLNEQVRRNVQRFPEDFCFRLTRREFREFLSQMISRSPESSTMRSQIASASRRNVRFLPYAFTEHGAIMAANVLNSPRAVKMSVFVVRAFIKMRRALTATREMTEKLQELENKLTERLDTHERGILYLLEEIRKLMNPPLLPEPKKRPIGFGRDDT